MLLQYVREGWGLVVGGHAWFWASNSPRQSSLLNHPGNQLLTHFGLALSARLVEHRDAAFPMQTAKAGRDFLLPFFQKYLNSTLL